MKNMHNKNLGDFGEDAACNYLKNKGYNIIKRNFSCRGGEVDIISKIRNCLVFVEVKTRQNSDFGAPSEAVDFRKIEKIKRVVEHYLLTLKWDGDIRIDVIEVYAKYQFGRFLVGEINHIEHVVS